MTAPNNKSENVTIRLSKNTKARLERLAKTTKRSRNYLAAEAIADFVELNEWQIAGLKKAIRELDAGKGVPHAKVSAWIDSLGTDHELPRPRSTD
jgi:RHH-type transcriptional regulator, rel operon repressor / antitoxin RelB